LNRSRLASCNPVDDRGAVFAAIPVQAAVIATRSNHLGPFMAATEAFPPATN
jgi:hypothetical protein